MSDKIVSIENLISLANAGKVRFWPEGEKLHYRAPKPMDAKLRAAVLEQKPSLLAHLAKWDAVEASRLAHEADGLVCESGVLGTDEEIQKAAALCAWGQTCGVMVAVRRGVALVEERVRKLVATKQEATA